MDHSTLKDRRSGLMTPAQLSEGAPSPGSYDSNTNGKRDVPQHSQSQGSSKPLIPSIVVPSPERSSAANLERLRESVYVRYLFEDFVLSPSRDTESGWLALLLPRLYTPTSSSTTLNLSVRAAAYAYIGNKRKSPELQLEAREMYGSCLKALASDLTSLEIATSTSTSVAVLILGLYEVSQSKHHCSFHKFIQVYSLSLAMIATASGIHMVMGCRF